LLKFTISGKTSTAELFAEQSGFNHINVSQLVKERGFHEEQRDEEYDSLVIDEEAVIFDMSYH
jgi:adenylate kinase